MIEPIERMRKLVNDNLVMGLRFQMNRELNKLESEIEQELNSRAERTCKMEPTFINPQVFENVQEFTCTACGRFAIVEQLGDDEDRPNYCPNCGAKVVKR